ncbi:hypothetical protein [Vibrio sp. 10N.261.54.A5]|uniref:hypothetical protein n=1 Tax=Vibrio sp. 10N.261.54.A5 TaxID=3229686 RepID=UPI00354D1E2E
METSYPNATNLPVIVQAYLWTETSFKSRTLVFCPLEAQLQKLAVVFDGRDTGKTNTLNCCRISLKCQKLPVNDLAGGGRNDTGHYTTERLF